jgi:nucleoside-diphosphate-sugar epimerase
VKVLIFGLGYVGSQLAKELCAAGHEVVGVKRTLDAGPSGDFEIRAADVLNPADLRTLPQPVDALVNCVSSSRGGVDVFRSVFGDGTKNLLDWLSPNPPKRLLFTSSSSVYGQTDGSWVTETSEAKPDSETGQILVAAEREILRATADWDCHATILRVAGIYGPERGHLFLKYLRDEAKITGDPTRHLNQIHRDDVAGVISQLLEHDSPPEMMNVADDEPVTQSAFFEFLSRRLGKEMPPTGESAARRKRAVTDKRVSNRLLREEFAATLKFPTFREGYLAEMKRLGLNPTR